MYFITEPDQHLSENASIGGKAGNLYRLKNSGFNVPKWIVIPQEVFLSIVPSELQNADYATIISHINAFNIPASFIDEVANQFNPAAFFAVRSSALDEDGKDFSFAGQFESHLYVNKENLEACIKKVWCSALSDRVQQYRKNNHLTTKFGIAVIVQEMINADVAGVAFGINPSNGDRNAKIVSAVYGLGEGLVSGELDADNFIFSNGVMHSQLAYKVEKIVFDTVGKTGTKKIAVEEHKRNASSLSEAQVNDIVEVLDSCRKEYGRPQDVEFAIANSVLYLLQTRPITNLNKIPDPNGAYILWDNSNIIESYPGVNTPLTFSFIRKSYEGAYKHFCAFMGVNEKIIKQNERVFANTLGLMNGHVFYNLKSWYHMLAMLPGYSINARFMEKMMGVKERFDIPEGYRLSKTAAWWSIIKMMLKMYFRFLSLPAKRKQFTQLLNATIAAYKKIDYSAKNANELMHLYLDFERKLLNEWKAPLLNDFFAMVWFGMLQKRCEEYKVSENRNIHNDLLCGNGDIISTQPIHRTIALATAISNNPELKEVFINQNEGAIWHVLKEHPKFSIVRQEIDRYIEDFGERCVGELKLETTSYAQDPRLFIKILKSYVETGITVEKTSGNLEEQLRAAAEKEVHQTLRKHVIKRILLKRTLRNTRQLVSSRENLRYQRTRAFGVVREIFSAMGSNFYSEGIIEHHRDIFYLTMEEIFSFIEGTSVTQNIKNLIQLRKTEYAGYQTQEPPSERFATYGPVYHANDFFGTDKIEKIEGDLKGIGCCPGRVRAKAMVIRNHNDVSSLNGCILVTSSTDPGWVTLFPSAAAIIVERGSLLSHSAIVSREMGIPCIVSVTGLLKAIKTGDEIEMDGSTGEIKILGKAL